MKSFLAGLGLGFGLGVLLAPMSGQELRDSIVERSGDLADTARDQYSRVKDTAASAIGSLRGESERPTRTSGRRTGTE